VTPKLNDGDFSSAAHAASWASRIGALGLELAVPIGLGAWLDLRWGTRPWLLMAGAILGILAFSVHLLRLSEELSKKPQERRKSPADRPS
jgi:F0F1-type ATP synthase assembly protein I